MASILEQICVRVALNILHPFSTLRSREKKNFFLTQTSAAADLIRRVFCQVAKICFVCTPCSHVFIISYAAR